jgi:hypothetical protein
MNFVGAIIWRKFRDSSPRHVLRFFFLHSLLPIAFSVTFDRVVFLFTYALKAVPLSFHTRTQSTRSSSISRFWKSLFKSVVRMASAAQKVQHCLKSMQFFIPFSKFIVQYSSTNTFRFDEKSSAWLPTFEGRKNSWHACKFNLFYKQFILFLAHGSASGIARTGNCWKIMPGWRRIFRI